MDRLLGCRIVILSLLLVERLMHIACTNLQAQTHAHVPEGCAWHYNCERPQHLHFIWVAEQTGGLVQSEKASADTQPSHGGCHVSGQEYQCRPGGAGAVGVSRPWSSCSSCSAEGVGAEAGDGDGGDDGPCRVARQREPCAFCGESRASVTNVRLLRSLFFISRRYGTGSGAQRFTGS